MDEEVTRTGVSGVTSARGSDASPSPEPGAIEWAPSRKSHPMQRITTGSIPRMGAAPVGRLNVGPPPGSAAARRGPAGAGRNLPLAAPPESPAPTAPARSTTTQMSVAAGPASATPWGTELDFGPASDSGLKLAEPWKSDSDPKPRTQAIPVAAFVPPSVVGASRPGVRGATGSGPILELDLPAPRSRTGVHQAIAPMPTMRVRALPAPARPPIRSGTAPITEPRGGGEVAAAVFIAGVLALVVLLWLLI
jgi:hypothetical protein